LDASGNREQVARALAARMQMWSRAEVWFVKPELDGPGDLNDEATTKGGRMMTILERALATTESPPSRGNAPSAEANKNLARSRGNGTAGAVRPRIQLVGGSLADNAVACERILSSELYVRAGQPVRIGTAAELQDADAQRIERDAAQPVVLAVGAEYMRRRLTEMAEFQRPTPKGWRSVDCPKELANNIIGYGDWPHFRTLTAIAVAPFFRADFSICETPGYDAATGIYYQPAKEFPKIPAAPSRADAMAAMQALLAPFDQFPFATDIAVSAFVSHILSAVTRASTDVAPVFMYSAPLAGTGKTKLMRMANRIANGCEPAMRPYTDEGEELRKVLYAILLAGDPTICFDNLNVGTKVRSPTLCGFVTALKYNDRRLGTSETQDIHNRTLVTLTGNNITTAGDLARRSIICRLVLNAERTDGREFRIPDLDVYVSEHRAVLLCAALTIIRGYIVAGRPFQAPPMPSFERWSALARDPLLWLGMADPVASQETETEDEIQPLCEAFRAIGGYLDARELREFKARVLAGAVGYDAEPMHDALEAAGCSDATDTTKVGYWLRHNLDRTAGGYKLLNSGGESRAKCWRLVRAQ
jgi:putative DNA primase/helicase